jgi:endonuclease G
MFKFITLFQILLTLCLNLAQANVQTEGFELDQLEAKSIKDQGPINRQTSGRNKSRQIRHRYYQLSFNFQHGQAEWVSHTLNYDPEQFVHDRTNDFREDPVLKGKSPSKQDYEASGFDRGHLAPSQDFAFSERAVSESFYYSNMSPQDSYFNQFGLWKNLEEKIRRWSFVKSTRFFIFSGPVLTADLKKLKPGSEVSVPKKFYKVILAQTANGKYEAIGFIMPNLRILRDSMLYAVSVDTVEKLTGLDFYSHLPDAVESATEKSFAPSFWKK